MSGQRLRQAAAAAILVGLAACSGSQTPSSSSARSPGSTASAAQALAARMGCVGFEQEEEPELYVSDQADCGFAQDQKGTYPITIYVFAGSDARDAWLEGAPSGLGPLVVGPAWVVWVGTDCAPVSPCNPQDRARVIAHELGGEVR